MADQSWLSMVCAAALASFLGHFYQKWVSKEAQEWIGHLFFGGMGLFLLFGMIWCAWQVVKTMHENGQL